jgi:group I intron endonuclease
MLYGGAFCTILYKIINQINQKIYIGQTQNVEKRWRQHKYIAAKAIKRQYIHKAMAKYGVESFDFQIIATCKTWEDADETEKLLIIQYDSRNPDKGYNVSPGGYHTEM